MTVRRRRARLPFLPTRVLTLCALMLIFAPLLARAGAALPVVAQGSANYRPFNPAESDPHDTRTTLREDRQLERRPAGIRSGMGERLADKGQHIVNTNQCHQIVNASHNNRTSDAQW